METSGRFAFLCTTELGTTLKFEWTSDYQRLHGAPLTRPEEVQKLLRQPLKHWKKGRSAYESAHAWIGRRGATGAGLPAPVRDLIFLAPEWRNASIVAGFFEHATALDTQRGPSNTDIMIVCGLDDELGILGVEAKAGEPFGPRICDWLSVNPSKGKTDRWRWACEIFGVTGDACQQLRWQLFHRTASTLIEARRFRAKKAIMLIHDFCPEESWAEDYAAFANAIGIQGARVGALSEPKTIQGVDIRLGWVRDKPSA